MAADTYSNTLGFLIMGTGNDNNTWGTNANASVFQVLEDAIANALTSTVTGGTLDLSGTPPPAAASQVRYAALIFNGTLGSNQVVQVPNLIKSWWVQNATAGAFTLKIKTPSGSASTAIPQNSGWQLVQCDGANGITVSPFNTKQIQMPDGTAALPAYSNITETNSGLYRAGTQDWRFTINGSPVLQITGAGAGTPSIVNVLSPNVLQVNGVGVVSNGSVIAAADGTVSAPGHTFSNELGSGLYRIGAGDVGFAILGVSRLEITSVAFAWAGSSYAGTDVSASISTSQVNFNPANLNAATCLRLNVTATCSLTGLAGGTAGREIELLNVGTATLQCAANAGTSLPANQFANTFNLAPGQSITLRYDATSSLWRPKNVATAYSSCAIAAVSGDLLIVNGGSPNTQIAVTASEAVLTDTSGNAIKFENVSVTLDSTTTGPGGCDVGTRAVSTPYFLYLISDGVNINVMASTSASAPALTNATNYIYKKRIGWSITDSASNFLRIRQSGRIAQYVVGTNPANSVILVSGGVGTYSLTSPTLGSVSVSSVVPSTAVRIHLSANSFYKSGSNLTNILVAPNTAYGGANNGPAGSNGNCYPYFVDGSTGSGDVLDSVAFWMGLESTNIAVAQSNGAGIACLGWEDNI